MSQVPATFVVFPFSSTIIFLFILAPICFYFLAYELGNICMCFTPEIFWSKVEELKGNQNMIKNKVKALVTAYITCCLLIYFPFGVNV